MTLTYAHDVYFVLGGSELVVALDCLVPTKPPSSQPTAVATAADRMRDAAVGKRPRRPPISVSPLADGRYQIIDGNATYGAALKAGWPDLPVSVVADAGAAR